MIERFHGNLMHPVNTGRMELYKKEMTPEEIRMADFVAGKYAGIFHYHKPDKGTNLMLWLKSRPMVIYGFIIFKLYVWGSYLPARINLWLSVKLLVLVRAWHYLSKKM